MRLFFHLSKVGLMVLAFVAFGFQTAIAQEAGTIHTYVWNDTNANGLQDADEVGISDVNIFMFNEAGDQIGFSRTNNAGEATFNRVPVKTKIRLKYEPRPGYGKTKTHVGRNQANDLDSDAGREG